LFALEKNGAERALANPSIVAIESLHNSPEPEPQQTTNPIIIRQFSGLIKYYLVENISDNYSQTIW